MEDFFLHRNLCIRLINGSAGKPEDASLYWWHSVGFLLLFHLENILYDIIMTHMRNVALTQFTFSLHILPSSNRLHSFLYLLFSRVAGAKMNISLWLAMNATTCNECSINAPPDSWPNPKYNLTLGWKQLLTDSLLLLFFYLAFNIMLFIWFQS